MSTDETEERPKPNHIDNCRTQNPIHAYVIWGALGGIVGPIGGCYGGYEILTRTMGPDYWIAGVMYGSALGLMLGPFITAGLRYLILGRR